MTGPNREPPRLMDLVYAHGGYDKITPEAWAAYDREMAAYKADVASGALWPEPEEPPDGPPEDTPPSEEEDCP